MDIELREAVQTLETNHRHWRELTGAIDSYVRTVASRRSVTVRTERGTRSDDGALLFMMASGENVLVLAFDLADCRLRREYYFADGSIVTCGYALDRHGVWTGPLAPGAENRCLKNPLAAARDISDGWLLGVLPRI